APLVARHFLPEAAGQQVAPGDALALAVEGTEGLVLTYGKCCHPLPGDDIRGNVSVGRGIVVHRLECKHAKSRPQDWVPLVWSEAVQGDYIAELKLKAGNQRGLLARVTAEISAADSSIENVQMPDRAGSEAIEMRFLITVKNRIHLARVMKRLRRIEHVERVTRG
ncbi:MAG TPA: ACT domain-containing protein, partial [Nevskiaceae bacterium]|nr:ACT domain-containing protein [Nevskiaceae bacterium]